MTQYILMKCRLYINSNVPRQNKTLKLVRQKYILLLFIIRSHRKQDASYGGGLLLHTSDVPWSLCVSVCWSRR